MVKHIILWQLKDELTNEEKVSVKKGIKEGLESLMGKIEGLKEIKVETEGLASSNADVMLYSCGCRINENRYSSFGCYPRCRKSNVKRNLKVEINGIG